MADYPVRYTPLATAILGESLAAFEERLRGELAETLPEGYYPPRIIMHVVHLYQGRDYLALGCEDHLLVDTATYEDQGPIKEGPFKGKRVMMPVPDSDPPDESES